MVRRVTLQAGGKRSQRQGGRPTGVLAEVEELKDVRVPWLHVDGKGTLPLAATLVDVPRRKTGTDPKDQQKMVGIWGTGEEQAARHMAAHGRITYIHSCPLLL